MPRGVYERTPEIREAARVVTERAYTEGTRIKWLTDEELYKSKTQYWIDHPEAVELASRKATE